MLRILILVQLEIKHNRQTNIRKYETTYKQILPIHTNWMHSREHKHRTFCNSTKIWMRTNEMWGNSSINKDEQNCEDHY